MYSPSAIPCLSSSFVPKTPSNFRALSFNATVNLKSLINFSVRRINRSPVAVLDNNVDVNSEDATAEAGAIPTGEWPETLFSNSYDDLIMHYRTSLHSDQEPEAGEKDVEEASTILSKQWPETFFEHNVEDLAMHYRPHQQNNEDSVELDSLYPSGEWPTNLFAATYEDLKSHYVPHKHKKQAHLNKQLVEIMVTDVRYTTPNALVRNAKELLQEVSGLPVVINRNICVGIITRSDMPNVVYAVGTKVGEVMSSPPIVLKSDDTVKDAAILMLKHRIHHIPIVNDDQQLVGLVTRTHIFTALES